MPDPAAAPAAATARPAAGPGPVLAGLGVAVPERVVANAEIAARLGIDEAWIEQRTGVRERRFAAEEERLPGLAAAAAERALADAGTGAEDVDMVLVATLSNDELMPGAAPRVAAAIGASRAAAIDLNAACTGFVAALGVGAGLVESGRAGTVLTIGADLMSRLVDPEDRSTAALFGDGAGAVVLSSSERGRIGPVVLGSDGGSADLITAERAEGVIRMQGHETFRAAVDRLTAVTGEAAAAAGRGLTEIDLFVYHQANARILRAVGERLDLPEERVVNCIWRYGNASAATIPLALEEARSAGDLAPGAAVLLAGFGAGFTWGGTVIEWGRDAA